MIPGPPVNSLPSPRELPDGPWLDEPAHIEWRAHEMHCIVHRSPLGVWCGYVVVDPGHPWHGLDVIADEHWDTWSWVQVHGGITWSAPKQFANGLHWCIGFDCGHMNDMVPGVTGRRGTWRDIGFAIRETTKLAEQAHQAAGHPPKVEA